MDIGKWVAVVDRLPPQEVLLLLYNRDGYCLGWYRPKKAGIYLSNSAFHPWLFKHNEDGSLGGDPTHWALIPGEPK